MSATSDRLEYLRAELRAERISYAELAELQSLVKFIRPDDVELLEAAGVPEFPDKCREWAISCEACGDFRYIGPEPVTCPKCHSTEIGAAEDVR